MLEVARGVSSVVESAIKPFDCRVVYVAFVRAKAPGKALWDVEEFVDQGLLLVRLREGVIPLCDDFDDVSWRKMEGVLPDASEAMDAGNNAPRLRARAAEAIHRSRNDVAKA